DQRASSTSSRSIRRPSSSGSSCRATVSTSGSSGTPRVLLDRGSPYLRYPQIRTAALWGVAFGGARWRGRCGWSVGARPGVGAEVGLVEALAGEVGVHLGGRDVGVAEHLLDGAQVAAAGEQVGGEAVTQRVRAHPAPQSRLAGVALDDLVEALAGQ